MFNSLFRKPRGQRPEGQLTCCEWCQRESEDATVNNLNVERRLLELEAKVASAGSIDLLELKIDFALRLLDYAIPQRQGVPEAALSGREFQAETVESMFDLAVALIERLEQIEVPIAREDTGPESAAGTHVRVIGS